MRSRLSVFRFTLLSLVLALSCHPLHAFPHARNHHRPAPATIRLGTFGPSLQTLVAEQKGFFAEQNLTVSVLSVTSSTQQFQFLRDGQYDLISTSPDNIVNYRLNPNNALGTLIPGKVIAGTNSGNNLSLVGQPGMTSLTDFRGRSMVLDSTVSGFAFVMYKMLKNAGLQKDVDYTVVPCGGGTQRFQAMLNGRCGSNGLTVTGGAILSGGTEFQIADAGYPTLQRIQDVANLNPYLGGSIAAKEDWLANNDEVAVRFLAAMIKATDWILDPANREEALQILQAQPNTSRLAAERSYEVQVTPGVGLIPELTIDRRGLRTVLELRAEFGGFEQTQNINRLTTPAGGLYDRSYLRDAQRLVDRCHR
jgi:ABC-type nitrate/sulfonate/bicarbonate transport system substrate-binding protein